MKHVVHTASVARSEIDIPDACPGCGSDLRRPRALILASWSYGTVPSLLTVDGLVPEGPSEMGATVLPSSVLCAHCYWTAGMPSPATPDAITARLVAEGIDPQTVFGHFDTDGGPEIERDDEHAPAWFTDAHAVLLHRVRCGCLSPENKERDDFYGGRTCMPFATFSATAADLG